MTLVFLGLGLVFAIEGLALALAPSLYERLAEMLRETPIETRRSVGLAAATIGVILVWISQNLG